MSVLQDIVENEDIKLDRMFIASLVHDLIKVSMVFGKLCFKGGFYTSMI